MDPQHQQQQHYRFVSDEDELSEIMMMSFFATQDGINCAAAGGPNHYGNYYLNAGGGSSSSSIDLLNTPSSSSSEYSDGSINNHSMMTMMSNLEEEKINYYDHLGCDGFMFNIAAAGGDIHHANCGSTTSFSVGMSDVANCYWPADGPGTNCLRQPTAAPVAAGTVDNYPGAGQFGNNGVKVGQYTAEERKDRILRYLKKRNQRNFNKTIKYACRKTLADRRVRVRGRFARNNNSELSEDDQRTPPPSQTTSETNMGGGHQFNEAMAGAGNQRTMWQDGEEFEEDEWLQEAVASLLYAPYNNFGPCNVP